MTKVTIHAAKTNLSKLIANVEAGVEVVICRGDKEVAKLVPAKAASNAEPIVREGASKWDGTSPRTPGRLKGKIKVSDEFYDPWFPKDLGPGVMDSEPEWGEPGTWDGRSPRKAGLLKGVITLDDSFFDPLSDEELGLAEAPSSKKKP